MHNFVTEEKEEKKDKTYFYGCGYVLSYVLLFDKCSVHGGNLALQKFDFKLVFMGLELIGILL